MISIIIPTWNSAATLRACLDSIIAQTYKDVEVIVVDDASTDDTQQVLSEVSGSTHPIISIRHQTNQGPPVARNHGFAQSTGEYVMFCDADVLLRPSALQMLLDALSVNPSASYAFSSFIFGWKTFTLFPFDAKKLRQMPYIHTTSLIRREHFSGFDESLKRFQDWDMYLTMLEHHHTGVWVPEILFEIKNTNGTMSRWLPSFLYHIPWFPSVRRYREAERVIRQKHNLDNKTRT